MSSFDNEIHCDEFVDPRPTAADLEDYAEYLDSLDDECYEDDGQPDEAQEWYDFDPDC